MRLFKLVEGRHSTGRAVDWFKLSGFGSDLLYLLVGQQLINILLKANGPGLVQHLYKAQMFSPFPFFPFPFLQTEIEIVSTMNAISLFFNPHCAIESPPPLSLLLSLCAPLSPPVPPCSPCSPSTPPSSLPCVSYLPLLPPCDVFTLLLDLSCPQSMPSHTIGMPDK